MGCVYLVRNKINNKKYIGISSRDVNSRKDVHERDVLKGSKCVFHRALRKYGADSFEWSMLVSGKTGEELGDLERHYIKSLNTKIPHGYNMTDGGEGCLGRPQSEKTKAKLRQIFLGHPVSEETRRKISLSKTGSRYSEQARENMRKGQIGRIRPPISEEQKRRLRTLRLGVRHTSEAIEKVRKAHKGKQYRLGTKTSEETKKLLSKIMREYWAKSKKEGLSDNQKASLGNLKLAHHNKNLKTMEKVEGIWQLKI